MSKRTKKSPSPPYREKLDYVLSACLYCWNIWDRKFESAIQTATFYVMRFFVLIFLPQKYIYKFYRNHITFRENRKCSNYVGGAKAVSMTCMGYELFLVFAVGNIICTLIGWNRVFHWKDGIVGYIMSLTVMLLFCIIAFKFIKAPYNPNIYLYYFKKFKKKDEEWLKKWKIYTFLLFLGSFAMIALTMGFSCLCISIDKTLRG